ncbi:iron-containing alcohol dehydrogenase [Bisgaard Taxon 10/6]|uniref:iron-containing alcohol dehydrogenase n=1 Tax=Exercitatus varius TaxID=67857 RepID=UPI00294B6EA1|nr:iron-containing alcohol dehydrogenase [Exercitatus varius]MDG2953374.1 iron-containing alcohol dehydrogenase [Exercitatus varius]
MQNFNYFTPTRIIFGKNTEQQTGELIKAQGCKKILIHYGGRSAKKSGLLDRIKASLDNAGIAYTELGGVVPNPLLSLVYQGIDLCKKEKVDFILAVGGGSVIDSAKAIAYGVAEPDKDVWELYDRKRQAAACLPVATVLTIAAAGSEMSPSSVITKDEGGIKRGYSNDLSRPKFSILNPELTMTLPAYQTASGNADILMHTMERYFTPHNTMEITDSIAEGLLKTVMKNARILVNDPRNYEARAEIMWSGSLSHNGLTGCGGGQGDWATHMLEHELSGLFGVTHGAGLAAIWGHWARYVYKDCLPRFERFAVQVMGVTAADNAEQTALKGIEAMEDFFRSIGMPTNLSELGVNAGAEQIAEMARKCAIATNGCAGAVKPLYEQDMIAIYTAAQNA